MVMLPGRGCRTSEGTHEAAGLDGAHRWDSFRHVTLPFISPQILFTLVMGLIGAFQFFTPAYVMTNGTGGQ